MSWIINNLGTIVIFIVLAAVVCMILRSMKKNKCAGKTSCGCGCAHCAMRGKCHGGGNGGK